MSDIAHFFTPVSNHVLPAELLLDENQLGSKIRVHSSQGFPELEQIGIAIIGVAEDRNAPANAGCAQAPEAVREALYRLYPAGFEPHIADLGNILPGHSTDDTYFALRTSLDHLIRRNIVPIIIGGSQDLSYAQFLGYKDLEQTINMVSIDSGFDLGNPEEPITNRSFLGKIILHQPNFLFNYSNIGFQSYLVDNTSLQMMSKLYFDVYRLGQVRDHIAESEPVIRQADMLTFDMSAVRFSDAPGQPQPSPNGFYAEEACQMMRYAGMNDKLSSIGIYEINPKHDRRGQTSALAAQMIWCFLDGFYQRRQDFPNRTSRVYQVSCNAA
jgi:formiminoglutamase